MFRATVEETESTSPYEVGVGGLEKSLHVEREAAEVEHATVGASRGAGGGEQRSHWQLHARFELRDIIASAAER